MTRILIILNVGFALIFLPMAQAFVIPADSLSTSTVMSDHSTHCIDMENQTCDSIPDCDNSGMHCTNSISPAILFEFSLPVGIARDCLHHQLAGNYLFLPLLENDKPPRFF